MRVRWIVSFLLLGCGPAGPGGGSETSSATSGVSGSASASHTSAGGTSGTTDASNTGAGSGGGSGGGSGSATTGNTDTSPCADEDRADDFGPDLEKPGEQGVLRVIVVEAVPSAPIKGVNAWTVRIEEQGVPRDGLELEVIPFMPNHGHGIPTPPTVSPGAGPGLYQLDGIDLFMDGLWEVTLEMNDADVTLDSAQINVCVFGA